IHNGIINTLGGDGVITWDLDGEGGNASDDLGDGGPVSRATFISLSSVFADGQGNVLVTDSQSERVRMIIGNGVPPPTPTNPPPTPTNSPPPPTSTFTATPIPPSPTPPATATRTPTRTNTSGPSNVSVFGHVMYYANNNVDVPSVEVDLNGPGEQ